MIFEDDELVGSIIIGDNKKSKILIDGIKNKNKLEQLNSLVHPAVAKDGILWQQSQSVVPYTLKEAALLIESGSFQALDYLITVWAPKETRIQRVIKRDNITRHEVEARIDKQIPEFEKLRLAQFVIINDGKKSLVQQVQKLHQRFK